MLIAGCGSDDDESGGGSETSADTAAAAAVFESDEVGFTFEYPEEYVAETTPVGPILGQVSVEKGGKVNAIKVRKTADQELGTERYLEEFQRDFERTVGTVERREDTVGDLDVGILEFEDSFEETPGETVEFTSTSYFFVGGGKTWQLECIADAEHKTEIDEACTNALESVSFDDA